jgi:hypothetical protein
MKQISGGIALAALILGLSGHPTAAQMYGSINYPAIGGVGVKIAGEFARGLNDESLKSNYFGGRAELGLPFFNVWAGIGSVKPDDELVGGESSSEITYGGGAAFNLLKGPLVPVRVSVQAGAGYLSSEGSSQLTVPFGLAAAINVPTPGVGIVPWAYAFAEYQRISPDALDSTSKIGFGISGGVEVSLPMGLGFYGAVDWHTIDFGEEGETGTSISPLFVGAGLTYKIQVPTLGM